MGRANEAIASVAEVALSLLEPAPRRDAELLVRDRSRLRLRVPSGQGNEHDRDGEDAKKADQRQERDRRKKELGRFRLGAVPSPASPSKRPLARHGTEIIVGPGPLAVRRLR